MFGFRVLPRNLSVVLLVFLLLLFMQVLFVGQAQAADPLFEIVSIPNAGRSVAARIADFDGDRRADLMVVAVEGMPPDEQRVVRVYLQGEDGTLPTLPSHRIMLPKWSGVYDLADLVAWPGVEMVLLRPNGVSVLSLANASGALLDLPVAGGGTIATSEDERGFEPFKMVYREFGREPWILVPMFGRVIAIGADGKVRASLDVGRRSNYIVIPTDGLVLAESDIQLFIDVPKLAVGDVDGDGRVDIVSSTRHEIRVFLRREGGEFASAPDRIIPLALITPRDHIRGTGGVSCDFRDIDNDGDLDLLISHSEGSFIDAATTTYLFFNRDGGWHLDDPDGKFASEQGVASTVLVDIDRDGIYELLHIQIKFSLLEFVELLLTREIDAVIALHRLEVGSGFNKKPILKRNLGIPFSFDTFRPKGFIPRFTADLNRDGYLDLVTSGAGEALEVYLGGGKTPFAKRAARQKMQTEGVIEFADFNGDGLTDFVLYDPHNFDRAVQLAINTGALGDGGVGGSNENLSATAAFFPPAPLQRSDNQATSARFEDAGR